MRVFSMTTGADTAGVGIGIKRAFDRFGRGISVRAMVASSNYIGYPIDVPWSKSELQRQWDAADAVLIHNTLHAHHWYDDSGKPTVLMHHGLIGGFSGIVAEARALGIRQIGSTIDLSVHAPEIEWVGPPVDIDRMRAIWAANHKTGRTIRIAHAPTNPQIKGTSAFLDAMTRLGRKYPVEPVLIQRESWMTCLARKASADILFDQPVLGYGVNAIEAWAMGIPVIAGVALPEVRARMVETWGGLPFEESDEDGLYRAIERLLDPRHRTAMGDLGTEHVERWHSQRAVVARLSPVFQNTPASVRGRGERRLTPHQIRKVEALPMAQRALA